MNVEPNVLSDDNIDYLHADYSPSYEDETLLPGEKTVDDSSGDDDARVIGVAGMVSMIFFEVGGGVGIEPLVRDGGSLWALAGILIAPILWSIPLALATAELSTVFPVNGGVISWIEHAFGRRLSVLCGFWTLFSNIFDIGALILLAVDTLLPFQTHATEYWFKELHMVVSIVLLAIAIVLNTTRMETIERMSLALAVLSMIPLVAIVVLGMSKFKPEMWLRKRDLSQIHMGKYLSNLLWNLSGYEMAAACAGEVKNPGRVFPTALGISVTLCTIAYLLPLLVGLSVCPEELRWTDGFLSTEVAQAVGGRDFAVVAALVTSFSIFGTLNATIMVAARELQYMGELKLFPHFLGRNWNMISKNAAVILIGILSLPVIMFNFDILVELTTLLCCLVYILQFGAYVQLRRNAYSNKVTTADHFKLPGGNFTSFAVSAFPILFSLLILGTVNVQVWLLGILVSILGYGLSGISRSSVDSVGPEL